jgi:glutathione S-transferase
MSPTSPYARKCRIVVRERRLQSEVAEQAVSALDDPDDLLAANPLGKVPALLLPGDRPALFDSPLICRYLDDLGEAPKLAEFTGPDRWLALRREAMADGIMDAAVSTALELRRPDTERSPHWIARWRRAIDRALDAAECEPLPKAFDVSAIALACAVLYLDLRPVAGDWRAARPRLATWAAALSTRPSFLETRPPS